MALRPALHEARLVEHDRLVALQASGLLDGASTPVLDRLTRLASVLLQVPVSLVSLVDDSGQHFPGLCGLGGWAGERRGTPLSYSFCQYVASAGTTLIVEDARVHALVSANLAVPELGVIAYAGVPLRSSDGCTLGAFCAIDSVPRVWTNQQLIVLQDLAAAAVAEIESRIAGQAPPVTGQQTPPRRRDALTDLYQRHGFVERLRQHRAVAMHSARPFSVVALDLDGFTQINNSSGHDAGDQALVELAALLTAGTADNDVARMGCDEFLVLLTGADCRQAEQFMVHTRVQMKALHDGTGRAFSLHASMGSATWEPADPVTLTELLHAAEVALYADRRAGRVGAPVRLAPAKE